MTSKFYRWTTSALLVACGGLWSCSDDGSGTRSLGEAEATLITESGSVTDKLSIGKLEFNTIYDTDSRGTDERDPYHFAEISFEDSQNKFEGLDQVVIYLHGGGVPHRDDVYSTCLGCGIFTDDGNFVTDSDFAMALDSYPVIVGSDSRNETFENMRIAGRINFYYEPEDSTSKSSHQHKLQLTFATELATIINEITNSNNNGGSNTDGSNDGGSNAGCDTQDIWTGDPASHNVYQCQAACAYGGPSNPYGEQSCQNLEAYNERQHCSVC